MRIRTKVVANGFDERAEHPFSPINRIALHIVWALILLIPLHTAAQQSNRNKSARRYVIPAPIYHFTSGTSALGIPF